jgi:heterodisulfide reductase subunit C
MKQDVYELKNALQDHKNRLRLAQLSLELMENNYDELKAHRDKILEELTEKTKELERMKRIYESKGKCKNCESGCPASEITGRSCNP